MSKALREDEAGALALLDDAQQLLRSHPRRLLTYYAGALPFAVFFLYYWTEMARGAEAWKRHGAWSLLLALLFALHGLCQSLAFSALRRDLGGQEAAAWNARRLWKALGSQALVQGLGLFLLPLAALLTLPFGWAMAFFSNFSVMEDGEAPLRAQLAGAWAGARQRPGQNHLMLSTLLLFTPFALSGIAASLAALPYLLKTFAGIESEFTRSTWAFANSSFFMAVLMLGWLMISPLLKAAYTLRVHAGESLKSGADLREELKEFADAP